MLETERRNSRGQRSGTRLGTLEPGARQALPEAATAATGRGGAAAGPTPKTARASSSQAFKGNRHYLRVRFSRLSRRLAADVADGNLISCGLLVRCVGLPMDFSMLFQPVAGVVSGSRGPEREVGLVPGPLRLRRAVWELGSYHACRLLVFSIRIPLRSRHCPPLSV